MTVDERVPATGLILGCQRSGTTLLRLVLGSHSQVTAHDEALAYAHLSGRRRAVTATPWAIFKVPRLTEQLDADPVVDDHIGTFPGFYRREPAVFLVRDPRDVAASMQSLRQDEASWIQRWGRTILEHREATAATFAGLHAERLAQLREGGFPPHRTAALYWRLKNDALERYRELGFPVLPVLYERLVESPEVEIRRVLQHFGLPFERALLAHDRREHDQLEPDGLAIGGTDPRRAIDGSSRGRFEQAFSALEIDQIDDWTRDSYLRIQTFADRPAADSDQLG